MIVVDLIVVVVAREHISSIHLTFSQIQFMYVVCVRVSTLCRTCVGDSKLLIMFVLCQSQMKKNALAQIKDALKKEMEGPLGALLNLIEKFNVFDHFSAIVKSVKKAWNALING